MLTDSDSVISFGRERHDGETRREKRKNERPKEEKRRRRGYEMAESTAVAAVVAPTIRRSRNPTPRELHLHLRRVGRARHTAIHTRARMNYCTVDRSVCTRATSTIHVGRSFALAFTLSDRQTAREFDLHNRARRTAFVET